MSAPIVGIFYCESLGTEEQVTFAEPFGQTTHSLAMMALFKSN